METASKIQLIKQVQEALACGLVDAKYLVDECCMRLFGQISLPKSEEITLKQYNELVVAIQYRINAIHDNTARVIVSQDGTIIEERDCVIVELTPKQLFNIQECMTDSERYAYARTCGGRYVR